MISLGLKSLVSTRNFRCQAYLCHYTCFRGECTMPTNRQMQRSFPLDPHRPPHLTDRRTNSSNVAATEGHKPPPPFEPVTGEIIRAQIGIVQNFFLAKLHAGGDEPLVEDEDLPVKQRPPKPRLPPTGKISMPRKRPLHGQGGGSKKKKKPNSTAPPSSKSGSESVRKESVAMERSISKISEAGDDGNGGMISPESLAA